MGVLLSGTGNWRMNLKSSAKLTKFVKMSAVLVTLLLLSACVSGPPAGSCGGLQPFYPHPDDILTSQSQRAILANNLIGQQNCGWHPVRR